jgi:adenylylsulfate kinase-like enzyme
LIVISGPIASGKSTVAGALARECKRRGATAAVIDLDVVYEMLEPDAARKDDEKT